MIFFNNTNLRSGLSRSGSSSVITYIERILPSTGFFKNLTEYSISIVGSSVFGSFVFLALRPVGSLLVFFVLLRLLVSFVVLLFVIHNFLSQVIHPRTSVLAHVSAHTVRLPSIHQLFRFPPPPPTPFSPLRLPQSCALLWGSPFSYAHVFCIYDKRANDTSILHSLFSRQLMTTRLGDIWHLSPTSAGRRLY